MDTKIITKALDLINKRSIEIDPGFSSLEEISIVIPEGNVAVVTFWLTLEKDNYKNTIRVCSSGLNMNELGQMINKVLSNWHKSSSKFNCILNIKWSIQLETEQEIPDYTDEEDEEDEETKYRFCAYLTDIQENLEDAVQLTESILASPAEIANNFFIIE